MATALGIEGRLVLASGVGASANGIGSGTPMVTLGCTPGGAETVWAGTGPVLRPPEIAAGMAGAVENSPGETGWLGGSTGTPAGNVAWNCCGFGAGATATPPSRGPSRRGDSGTCRVSTSATRWPACCSARA